MNRTDHRRKTKQPGNSTLCIFMIASLIVISLGGCDSENRKAWKKWQIEDDKVDYRCGMFADYEFKINKKYLLTWPNYQGRSDWEVNGPPPLSCDAKLQTIYIKAYWPGLSPARGDDFTEDPRDASRIVITLERVGKLDKWDMNHYLAWRFGEDNWKNTQSYQKNKDNLNLDYARGPRWMSPKVIYDNYWVEDINGRISTFIECDAGSSSTKDSCTLDQYIPEMQAIIKIEFKKSKIKYWNSIRKDANALVKKHTKLKRI